MAEWRSKLSGPGCGALAGLAILLSLPFADMGIMDDWSYVRTAYDFARTGHFVYNGWATAMLGWQIIWSAPFLKLFGYSFTVARLSMLPFAFACGWLLHAILRRNMSNRNAVFGSLTFCLSPLFVPVAATYMSDCGGLFAILLCMYMCHRALETKSDRVAVWWLGAASLINVILGTERQIIWLGALVLVPSAAWLLRKRRGVATATIFFWIISALLIFACLHWFYEQPYSVPEKLLYPPPQHPDESTVTLLLHKLELGYIASKTIWITVVFLKTFFCLELLLLPVLIAWLAAARKLSRPAQRSLVVTTVVLGAIALVLQVQDQLDDWLAPWLEHVLNTEAISLKTWDMLGHRPIALTVPLRLILSVLVILSGIAFAEWLVLPRQQEIEGEPERNELYSWQTLTILYVPYFAAYVMLLVPRGLRFYIFDRYLLGIVPVVLLFLLKLYEERMNRSLPVASYLTLWLFAVYGVFATHDLFALNRARVAAVHEVRSSGVPENEVQAGFEFDGWTEIDQARYVNESKIGNPANAFHLNLEDERRPKDCRLGFDGYTPKLHPKFIVVLTPMWCLQPSRFASIPYRAWLPPFHRSVSIQTVPADMQDP